MPKLICESCQSQIALNDKFCPNCGKPVVDSSNLGSSKAQNLKTISSSGNYSGTMIKGKKSRAWKIMRNIILAIVLIGIIATVIWYKTDPNAGEKLGNILFGFVVMAIFSAVIWRKSKKGKMISSKKREANYDYDDIDDQDDDFDDD